MSEVEVIEFILETHKYDASITLLDVQIAAGKIGQIATKQRQAITGKLTFNAALKPNW